MEDNNCVIMDTNQSNQLIARIQMTSNKMFPLTLKPSKKKNTTQVVYDTNDAQSNTAFKEESEAISARSSKVSVHNFKEKGENGVEMQTTFQYEVEDDSLLWHFSFGHLNFGGTKLLHTKDMVI
jgi:hypothetical protein